MPSITTTNKDDDSSVESNEDKVHWFLSTLGDHSNPGAMKEESLLRMVSKLSQKMVDLSDRLAPAA